MLFQVSCPDDSDNQSPTVYMYVCLYIHAYMYICMHVCRYRQMYIHLYVCMYTHLDVYGKHIRINVQSDHIPHKPFDICTIFLQLLAWHSLAPYPTDCSCTTKHIQRTTLKCNHYYSIDSEVVFITGQYSSHYYTNTWYTLPPIIIYCNITHTCTIL